MSAPTIAAGAGARAALAEPQNRIAPPSGIAAAGDCAQTGPALDPPPARLQPDLAPADDWYVLDPIYAIAGEWGKP